MPFKTIATIVTDMDNDKDALSAAVGLARREDAHLEVLCLGIDQTQPGFYYAGASAVLLQDNLSRAQDDAAALEKAAVGFLSHRDVPHTIRAAAVPTASLASLVAHRTRLCDLVLLPKPYGEGRTFVHQAILEAALFNGAVPVLVVPGDTALPDRLDRTVVAWNESAEALTAVRAALPFLRQSETVSIAVIDPPVHGPDRSDPGGELSEVLSRHGVRPEISVLAKTMPRVSDIMCRHATETGAQLIVMGAYGHSRFREAILGGTTRNMLEMAEIPVLMAH